MIYVYTHSVVCVHVCLCICYVSSHVNVSMSLCTCVSICSMCVWGFIHVCAVFEYVCVMQVHVSGWPRFTHVSTYMNMCSSCMCTHMYCFMLNDVVFTPCEVYIMSFYLCSCILYDPCLHTCMFMRMFMSYGLDRSFVPPRPLGLCHSLSELFTSVYGSCCVWAFPMTADYMLYPSGCEWMEEAQETHVFCRAGGLDTI